MITLPQDESMTLAAQLAEEDSARRVGHNLRMLSSAFNARSPPSHGATHHHTTTKGFDLEMLSAPSSTPHTAAELDQAVPAFSSGKAPAPGASTSPRASPSASRRALRVSLVPEGEAALVVEAEPDEISRAVHQALSAHLDGPLRDIMQELTALRRDVNEMKCELKGIPAASVHVRVP